MRRLFDSQDIFATMCRRLDRLVCRQGVRAHTFAEFVSLMESMARHAILDKGRVLTRVRAAEGPDGPAADRMRERASDDGPTEDPVSVERLMELIASPVDRRILQLWLGGQSHQSAAEELGVSPSLVRKRWQLVRERLKAKLAENELDP